jgi:hypothetical protein
VVTPPNRPTGLSDLEAVVRATTVPTILLPVPVLLAIVEYICALEAGVEERNGR